MDDLLSDIRRWEKSFTAVRRKRPSIKDRTKFLFGRAKDLQRILADQVDVAEMKRQGTFGRIM